MLKIPQPHVQQHGVVLCCRVRGAQANTISLVKHRYQSPPHELS